MEILLTITILIVRQGQAAAVAARGSEGLTWASTESASLSTSSSSNRWLGSFSSRLC